jgi:hypothetical protein
MAAIDHFPSVAEMARQFRTRVPSVKWRTAGSWTAGVSTEEALRLCERGDETLVARAEKLLSAIETDIDLQWPAYVASVAGAYPIVPEAIMGLPEPMRRKVYMENDRTPIRVYVCTTMSAGVTIEQITERGVAVLALVMALGRIRPLELSVVSLLNSTIGSEAITCCRINTAPLDLATAAYALTSAAFARAVTYVWSMNTQHSTGSWPKGFRYSDPRQYLAGLRSRLGGTERDLIVEPARWGDGLLGKPVEWVNTQIRRYLETEPGAA